MSVEKIPTEGSSAIAMRDWNAFLPAEGLSSWMSGTREALLDAALRAQRAGLSVLPPREDGSKAPDGREWRSRQRVRMTEEEVQKLYAVERTGLGIVCGAVSGGLELFEFDDRETWHAYQLLAEDACLSGLLDRVEGGYLEETPGGGVHLLYYCETPINAKVARRPKRPEEQRDPHDRIKTLIETKGEGGYAIVAPSNGRVHPSGRPYVRLRGGFESIVRVTADEREALHELARTFDELHREQSEGTSRGENPCSDSRPGDDFNARTTWPEVLEPHGWVHVFDRGAVAYWRRPGKNEGISAAVRDDRLNVYSTSTPFEDVLTSRTTYDRFGAYAVLEHCGYLAAAAGDLGAKGFGKQSQGRAISAISAVRAEGWAAYSANGAYRATLEPDYWPAPLAEAALRGPAGEFVQLIAPHTESDPAALLIQLLAGFGSVVGRGRYFRVEDDRHHAHLFAVLVGRSSRGRKGTGWSRARARLAVLDESWSRDRVASGLSSGEGLIWAVRDPILRRERTKQGSAVAYVEVEADPGVEDKRFLVIEPEFASTLRVIAREGSTLSAIMRDAWDRGDLRALTKNSPARATGAHVSIIGHITRDELRAELTRTDAANGFANRFLFVAVKRSKLLPEGGQLGGVDFAALHRDLAAAAEFARLAGEVRRDGDARELWHAIYPELSADVPGLLGAVTSRAEAQVVRLSLLYALLDRAGTIQRPHLEAALAVWRYCAESARYVFGHALGDPMADEILRVLRASAEGKSRDEIRNHFGRHRSSEEIGRALALLARYGLAHSRPEPTRGRPVERWFASSCVSSS